MVRKTTANNSNPLANILAAEIKNQKLLDGLSKLWNAIWGSSTRDDKKYSKTFPNKKLTYWSCKNDHKLMFCGRILNKDISDRKKFVNDQKLCFNYLSKNHHVNDCISEFPCRHESCGRKHHILLHEVKSPKCSKLFKFKWYRTVDNFFQCNKSEVESQFKISKLFFVVKVTSYEN